MPAGRADALGVACFVDGLEAACEAVIARARAGRGGYACLANVHVLVSAVHDAALRRALAGAWTVFPDGAPVAWLAGSTGGRAVTRVPGPDLMPLVVDRGRAAGLRHFLFGSTPEVVSALRSRLDRDHPGARIVGAVSPPFGPFARADEQQLLEEIGAARPHVVWCALGAPKQELWMARNAAALAPAVVLGVGAAFDFLAGSTRRPPAWMRRTGLEWLGRLASEPGRLAGRYARTNPEFLLLAAFELLSAKRAP
jgi:N-acetylglucosaminyldiphosphoundecaprenol N-acetyl-beta-D-mannosaminyltransferase